MMTPGALPFSVFLSLYAMIEPVQADKAIEIDIPALQAVITGKYKRINDKLQDVYEILPEFNTLKDKHRDMEEAFRISSQIKQQREKKKQKVVLKKKKKPEKRID